MRLDTPCDIHQGTTNGRYGLVYVPGRGMQYAHRLVWEREHGPIPKGLYVCHRCDVPLCKELSHLFLGTPKDNVEDARSKGRLASPEKTKHAGETNGMSKLTRDDVARIRSTVAANPVGTRGGLNISEAARVYGVSRTTIRAALSGRSWR